VGIDLYITEGLDCPAFEELEALDREREHTEREACNQSVNRSVQKLKANIKQR
jgi:hypothetical protein